MENKVYVMTARQAAKAFPIDEEKFRHLKALQDAGIEPYIDDEHPDLSDSFEEYYEKWLCKPFWQRLILSLQGLSPLRGERKVLYELQLKQKKQRPSIWQKLKLSLQGLNPVAGKG